MLLTRIFFRTLKIIRLVVEVIIFMMCLSVQCPDAVEGILSPFRNTDHTCFTTCTDIPLQYACIDSVKFYPSDIEYKDYESSDYDPFDAGYGDTIDVNRYAFEQNSALSYDIINVNGITVAVGYENSIFTVDLLELIRDLSIEQINEVDNKGNKITTLTVDTEVAKALGVSKSAIQQALYSKRLIKKTYTISLTIK